ncbi:MAG: transposase IS200-family protein [Akkermansiaceae bacterium]|nr:transposase IS200-family protein [Akkermansiaceae bacterium]
MPQSLSLNILHLIFGTKDRHPFISAKIRADFHAYLATVARHEDGECYRVGGVADHVHIALRLSRTVAIADLVNELKTSSSRWIKGRQLPELASFAWQRGYAVFSVGPRHLDALVQYIDAQEEHHRTKSFQEEYRSFLNSYGIGFDERYVWD